MFKISIIDTPSQRIMVVEGTLVGPWVAELCTAWKSACEQRGRRKLVVDLRNLTTISHTGEDAIFDLMKEGAKFSCGNVLTNHVLKQLARKKCRECPGS
jgi:anti-anti-sigma regulatory factor